MAKKRVQSKSEMKRLAVLEGEDLVERNSSHFVDKETVDGLQRQHEEVQRQIAALPEGRRKEVLATKEIVDGAFNEMNDLLFSDEAFESDNRIARASQLDKEAGNYSVGTIFQYQGKLHVKTPFNKVIPAQTYVNVLQDQIIGTTKELTTQTNKFNSLGFVDLIKLAFKRLFTKGKNNG